MIPIRIKLHGFMPFRDEVELNFDTANLWMLCGRNGAGKSTIFDAITFALFGRGRFKGNDVQSYINQEVVRGNAAAGMGRTMSVQFDFAIGSQRYRVRRICTLTGKEGNEDLDSQRSVCKLDEQDRESPVLIGTTSPNGYLEWIKRTLGLDYDAFTASALLRQGESEKLMNPNSARDEILDRIINLRDYKNLEAVVKTVSDEWSARQRDAETQMAALKQQIVPAVNSVAAMLEPSAEPFVLAAPASLKDHWLASDELDKVARLLDTLTEIETNADTETTRLQARLDKLNTLEVKLDSWKASHKSKAMLLFRRAAYADLLGKAAEIERKFARAQELGKVLPLLRKWKKAQTDWRNADARRTQADGEHQSLTDMQEKLCRQRAGLATARNEAQTALSAITIKVELANAEKDALQKRKLELEQSEGQPQCHVCGKELSDEQRHTLREQVGEELMQAEVTLLRRQKEKKQAAAAAKTAENALTTHDEAIRQAGLDTKDQEKLRDDAAKDCSNAANSAQEAFDALDTVRTDCARLPVGDACYAPENWQIRLVGAETIVEALSSASFPDDADIASLQQESETLKSAPDEQKELAAARTEENTLKAQIATHEQTLREVGGAIADTAAELEDAGEVLMQSLHQAEAAMEADAALPDHSLTARVEQAALPPLELTTAAIEQGMAQQTSARQRARDARDVHTGLSEKHDGYAALLPKWKEANRYAHLYTTLTAKLGREGIQSWLRKEAERRIVEYADLILQRLTNGMLNVRLAANSTETLDLRVTDHEKNARDLKPGALSGSQKFRLSVALALGIGQYACGKSEGGIQSVIIDEGFGSLDKEGREQMTVELENLGKILKRIIVVSHQEDMELAFSNRWRIYTEGKTSKAELLA